MTPSTQWKENIRLGEPESLERLAERLREVQRKNKTDKVNRGLHAKSNVNLAAELEINGNLPEHAKVGIFASPGTYQTYVRFSNGSGKKQHDAKGDVRGVALKVLGVPGKKLIPGLESAKTQDFLLILTSSVPFKTAEEFIGLVEVANSPAKLPGFVFKVGLKRFLDLGKQLSAGLSKKTNSVAVSHYYTPLPVRWGQYAARYALKPTATDAPSPDRKDPEFLAKELIARLKQGPLSYEFQVQFFVDEQSTPIEDPTVNWSSPFVTLGKLNIKQQDLSLPEAVALSNKIEGLSFDPWHAPEEFRPLGEMMRARNAAYRLSTMERGAAPEPE